MSGVGRRDGDWARADQIDALDKGSGNSTDQTLRVILSDDTAVNVMVDLDHADDSVRLGDGANLQGPFFDLDTGAGTEWQMGVSLRKAASGGSVELGTASDPVRVDPTGSTTQPISNANLDAALSTLATAANQSTEIGHLATLAGTVAGSEQQVDVVSSALPTGASTEAKQDVGNGHLATLAGAVSGTEVQVDVVSSALPTGAATEATLAVLNGKVTAVDTDDVTVTASALPTGASTSANQTTAIGHLATLAGAVSGTEVQVDVVASLPAGTNNIGDVDLASALPAGTNTIGAVNVNGLDVVDFLDTPLLDASSSNIPASASTPLTVVAGLAADVSRVQVADTTGGFIGVYSDPAGTPVLEFIIGPGSDQTIEVQLPASTVIGVRNMENAAISTGMVIMNFMG